MLAHQFMRTEREDDWILQRHCIERMMSYFFVAGLHHFARYISWHLRDVQQIQHDVKEDLLNGSHVCRHTEGAAAHVYQTGKISGGLYRAYRPTLNKSPFGSSRSVFVLILHLQCQLTECAILTQDLHQRQQL